MILEDMWLLTVRSVDEEGRGEIRVV